jgi:hypothetical protein
VYVKILKAMAGDPSAQMHGQVAVCVVLLGLAYSITSAPFGFMPTHSNPPPPLYYVCTHFQQKHLSQRMMRARVMAQGFTIVVLMAGKRFSFF